MEETLALSRPINSFPPSHHSSYGRSTQRSKTPGARCFWRRMSLVFRYFFPLHNLWKLIYYCTTSLVCRANNATQHNT